jgi:hypothetical protein
MLYRAYLALAGFELTTSVMIGSYAFNYHTITTMTAPFKKYEKLNYSLKEYKSLILPFKNTSLLTKNIGYNVL